jgi:hypothetical protein
MLHGHAADETEGPAAALDELLDRPRLPEEGDHRTKR